MFREATLMVMSEAQAVCLSVHLSPHVSHTFSAEFPPSSDSVRTHRCPIGIVIGNQARGECNHTRKQGKRGQHYQQAGPNEQTN